MTLKTAVNLGTGHYFGNNKPFLNLIYTSTTNFDPTTRQVASGAKKGWLADLQNAESATLIIQVQDIGGVTDFTYLPSGTYHVRSNSGATVTLFGDGTSNGRTVVDGAYSSHYAVDVAGTNPALSLKVENLSGSTIADISDIQIYWEGDATYDYEALLDAGEIFDPYFLASVDGIEALRLMDWNNTMKLGVSSAGAFVVNPVEFSDLPAETQRVWMGDGLGTMMLPPSLAGKLSAKADADIWYPIPPSMTPECIEAVAEAVAQNMGSKKVWVAPGNELWNRAFPWVVGGNECASRWAESISIVDNDGDAVTKYTFTINAGNNTLESAIDLDAVFATGDGLHFFRNGGNKPVAFTVDGDETDYQYSAFVRKVSGTEFGLYPTSADATADTNRYTLDGPDQDYVAVHRTVGLFAAIACGGAELALTAWAAFEAELGTSRVVRVLEGQHANSDTGTAALEYTDPSHISAGTKVKNIAHRWATAPYFGPQAGGTITDVTQAWMMANHAELTNAWWLEACRNNFAGSCRTRVQAHKTMLASKAPLLTMTSYEGGHHFQPTASAEDGFDEMMASFRAFIDSQDGKTAYAEYAEMLEEEGVEAIHQYVDSGNYTETNTWGMVLSQFYTGTDDDSPRAAWLRGFAASQSTGLNDESPISGLDGGSDGDSPIRIRALLRKRAEQDALDEADIEAAVPFHTVHLGITRHVIRS